MRALFGFSFVGRRVWGTGSCPHLLFGLDFRAIQKNSIIPIVRGSSTESRLNCRALVYEVVAMSQDKTIPVSVIALRADDYSPDGKNVIISLSTKYSRAERKFSVPIECFHDLIVDLQRLNAAARSASIGILNQPTIDPNRADDLNRWTMVAAA
jgi:hypothetical protein